jgi:hypothetical protein
MRRYGMKPIHWLLLNLVIVASVALQVLGPEHPYPHAWDLVPLFYGAFGFVGCVLIIVVSKALGKALLQKPEDYYERDR